jgi:hypothetical protein
MEEDEDDFYDPADTLPHNQGQNGDRQLNQAEAEEYMEEEVEDDEVGSILLHLLLSHCLTDCRTNSTLSPKLLQILLLKCK